jgi:CBS domain containing-hemolysin-like protein
MFAVMALLCFIVFICLVLVAGILPKRTTMSSFELTRRKTEGNKEATATLRREHLLGGILALQKVKVSLLLVIFVLLSVATFGWLLGVILSVVVALEYNAVARLSFFSRQSQKIYAKYEPLLLSFISRYPKAIRFIQSALPPSDIDAKLDSKEELEYLVKNAGVILSSDEKKRIVNGLSFGKREVKEIMTPRGMVDSISKNEVLGPFVLDDLHKTGHSRFPVIDGDVDHIVGMLFIQDLLVVDSSKRSGTVEKAMNPRVFYIHEHQTLAHALAAFIRTRHHLFIVINEFRETVGVISLEDVIEALLGHKIVDEFDTHEDLRVVAARNPRGNNHPEKREDV